MKISKHLGTAIKVLVDLTANLPNTRKIERCTGAALLQGTNELLDMNKYKCAPAIIGPPMMAAAECWEGLSRGVWMDVVLTIGRVPGDHTTGETSPACSPHAAPVFAGTRLRLFALHTTCLSFDHTFSNPRWHHESTIVWSAAGAPFASPSSSDLGRVHSNNQSLPAAAEAGMAEGSASGFGMLPLKPSYRSQRTNSFFSLIFLALHSLYIPSNLSHLGRPNTGYDIVSNPPARQASLTLIIKIKENYPFCSRADAPTTGSLTAIVLVSSWKFGEVVPLNSLYPWQLVPTLDSSFSIASSSNPDDPFPGCLLSSRCGDLSARPATLLHLDASSTLFSPSWSVESDDIVDHVKDHIPHLHRPWPHYHSDSESLEVPRRRRHHHHQPVITWEEWKTLIEREKAFRKQAEQLQQDIGVIKGQLEDQKVASAALAQDNAALANTIRKFQDANREFARENEALRNQVEAERGHEHGHHRELRALQREVQMLKSERVGLLDHIAQLREDLKRGASSRIGKLLAEIGILKKDLRDVVDEKNEWRERYERQISTQNALRDRIQDMQCRINRLQDDVDKCRRRHASTY
ncbi:hypothetical protein MKZ38_003262 [Zalerion maritima]|uniref:Uncharacterized protein n=1 Tax=Zalerion maritima TaxID=339359 RepID=A0AAD5RP34_9PEZI|nr:hypothetical protein MKZ38_003262 [Zalerion maritima]